MFKKFDFYIINTNSPINIPPGYIMYRRIKIQADTMCKYIMEIDIQYSSLYYNDEFYKHSVNKIIKTISNHYYITSNPSNVVVKFFKKFIFSTNLTFKVKDKIVSNNMDKSNVEINVINPTPYSLHIKEISLLMDNLISNSVGINNQQLDLIKNENSFFYKSNGTFIEPDEEVNFTFTIVNYKNFINTVK